MMAPTDAVDAVQTLQNSGGEQDDCIVVSVTRIDGIVVKLNMVANSMVQDLMDAAARSHKVQDNVDKVHAPLLDVVLLTENGVVMEKGLKLSHYGLNSDSMVMMVKKRHINGRYKCWVAVDNSIPGIHGMEKFTLEIKDQSVTVNGVEGTANADIDLVAKVSVTFSRPITIKLSLPHSRASFRATGCEFQCRSCDYSSSWWHHIEGRLLGDSVSNGLMKSNGAFKGRFCEDNLS